MERMDIYPVPLSIATTTLLATPNTNFLCVQKKSLSRFVSRYVLKRSLFNPFKQVA